MSNRIFGGWSQRLSQAPLQPFNTTLYGMVTNLPELTTGTATHPGWSPKQAVRPYPEHPGKILWSYGGGGCAPVNRPSSEQEVEAIVMATTKNGWDGVSFDDECRMNLAYVTQAMSMLQSEHKETSYGFIAGWAYNHPETAQGKQLTEKVKQVIECGFCGSLIHYCYDRAMWSPEVIQTTVRSSLERSLSYGMPKEKIVLALTTAGLNEENLNYFLDSIVVRQLGGLLVWNYQYLTDAYLNTIIEKLQLTI